MTTPVIDFSRLRERFGLLGAGDTELAPGVRQVFVLGDLREHLPPLFGERATATGGLAFNSRAHLKFQALAPGGAIITRLIRVVGNVGDGLNWNLGSALVPPWTTVAGTQRTPVDRGIRRDGVRSEVFSTANVATLTNPQILYASAGEQNIPVEIYVPPGDYFFVHSTNSNYTGFLGIEWTELAGNYPSE